MDNRQNQNNSNEQVFTVNSKTVALKTEEERKAELESAKASLKAKLDRGEIDGVEYNRQLIDLMVPNQYEAKPPKSKIKLTSAIAIIVVLLVVSIPVAINLNWRSYFQNTLTAQDVIVSQTPPSDSSTPIQIEAEGSESGEYKGRPIRIDYKYYYDITGTVASVHDYWGLDDYSSLVPRDVCMVWGSLADLYVNHKAEFYQEGRFCSGQVTDSGLEPSEVFSYRNGLGVMVSSVSSMSNNHLIPSTPEIRQKIFELSAGERARIKGYLVRVQYGELALDSSISRTDNGDGACEVIYVTSVENITPQP